MLRKDWRNNPVAAVSTLLQALSNNIFEETDAMFTVQPVESSITILTMAGKIGWKAQVADQC